MLYSGSVLFIMTAHCSCKNHKNKEAPGVAQNNVQEDCDNHNQEEHECCGACTYDSTDDLTEPDADTQ
jgi:hypothetical protein